MFIILKQLESEVIMVRGQVTVNYITKVLIIVTPPVRDKIHFPLSSVWDGHKLKV